MYRNVQYTAFALIGQSASNNQSASDAAGFDPC